MKKSITISLLLLLIPLAGWAQIITTTPTFVTQNNGAIDIVYDAGLGTAGLKDYTGTDGIYAHAGVITTASTSNNDWKHAPTWGDNATKYKLTALGNNKYKLSITPDMATYYGLTAGETVTKMAFVFRNGLSTKEGKDTGGADILVNVYQTGLNIAFTTPATNLNVTAGTTLNIQVGASATADINLKINGSSVQTATAATSLSFSYNFAAINDYILIASATANGTTVYDTVKVSVPAPVTSEPRPAGVKDGINIIDATTATLVLYAPNKSNVFLIGDFNDWTQSNNYQLKKDGNYWWITLTGLTSGKLYGYQYLVDGTLRISDPYTELVLDPWNDKWINQYNSIFPNLKAYPEGKTSGLVATLQTTKTPYSWEVPTFAMPPRANMVIYELLLRDFTTQKSLEAAITHLDYLKTLGITAVELMPIQEFDGNNSWGYNSNHHFAPDKAYGTPEMYKKFIDECHKRGMAVLLDMVFNQASGINPFALLYWDSTNNRPAADNPWMNPVAPHPYSVLNDFNHSFTGTKEYFKRVLQYWITEYKVDGYRMDLTKGFTQTATTGEPGVSNYDQSRIDNLTAYYNAAKSVKSDVMFILEHFCSNEEETVLANSGMYLWKNASYNYSQSAMGYQTGSDFGTLNTTPRNWVGYAESHDEERNFYNAKINGVGVISTDSIARIKRVPLNIAFTALLPGPKMIWQFGEMGYDYSINSNGGRTNEKSSAWGYLTLTHRKAAADECAKVISLKKLYPNAFTQGTYTNNVSQSDWNTGRRIALSHADLSMVMLGNFNASATINANPNFPKTGIWYNLLTGEELNVTNTSMTISMQAGDLLLYTDRKVNFTSAVNNPKTSLQFNVFPTVTAGKVYVTTPNAVKEIKVYNMQGLLLKTVANQTEVDLATLSTGIYLMEVSTIDGKESCKIVKQ
ncbi:MAG: T9SS type A sorting domain-containing protein [Paludibacter sp.]|nr:T9SS type A sorting domain-containing protein [Paludibacter sp.]